MGIPANKVYVLTFAIGFALAAFGGAVACADHHGGLPRRGQHPAGVLHGGDHRRAGNLPGTAAAAVLLAFMEGVIQSFADPTVARIASLVLMSAVLLMRPQGLFKGFAR